MVLWNLLIFFSDSLLTSEEVQTIFLVSTRQLDLDYYITFISVPRFGGSSRALIIPHYTLVSI
jgi:hypothetical protein